MVDVRLAPSVVISLGLLACGQGSVEVVLRLPIDPSATPGEATQIVLRADRADGDPVTLTAPIRDNRFELGDLPVDDYTAMTVELRGASGGTVGYGRAGEALDVSPTGALIYEIPVRRPRTYLAGPTPEETVDAPDTVSLPRLLRVDRGSSTIESLSVPLAADQAGAIVASAGPDLFLAVGPKIYRLDSSTDELSDQPIATAPATITDLTGTLDGRFLVASAGANLVVVETATGATRVVGASGPVGAVTLGHAPDGGWLAVGLVDAARTATQCPRQSSLLVTTLGLDDAEAKTIALGTGVADVAGPTARPYLIAAALCSDRVLAIDLATDEVTPISEPANVPCDKSSVCAPSAVAASDDQAWVGGTVAALLAIQVDGDFQYTSVGAHHQLATIDLSGAPRVAGIAELSELQQVLEPTDRLGFVLNRNMKARVASVSALSVSADGSIVTLCSNSQAKATGVVLTGPFAPTPYVPAIALHVSYQIAISTQTGAVETSLRTRCHVCASEPTASPQFDLGKLCVLTDDYLYPSWACAPYTGGEPVTDFEGGSSSSLFGRP